MKQRSPLNLNRSTQDLSRPAVFVNKPKRKDQLEAHAIAKQKAAYK